MLIIFLKRLSKYIYLQYNLQIKSFNCIFFICDQIRSKFKLIISKIKKSSQIKAKITHFLLKIAEILSFFNIYSIIGNITRPYSFFITFNSILECFGLSIIIDLIVFWFL